MVRQFDIYPDLRKMIEDILYQGKRIPFSPDIKSVSIGLMFGFLKEKENQVVVANRIFEMRMLNMFIAEEASDSGMFSGVADSYTYTGAAIKPEILLPRLPSQSRGIMRGRRQPHLR